MIEFTQGQTLQLTLALAGTSTLIQALETLWIRDSWTDSSGIWRWSDLKAEFQSFPKPARWALGLLLQEPGFTLLNLMRIVAALVLLAQPSELLVSAALGSALLGSTLTSLRWRGAFNGGSDSMTLVVLLPLVLSRLPWPNPELATRIALAYIALQSLLSYFVAGLVKIVEPNWRNGSALGEFLGTPQYGVPVPIRRVASRPATARLLAWSVMLFELLAPATLISPT